jgi:hypothetical protein
LSSISPSPLSHPFLERIIFANCVDRQDMSIFGKKIKSSSWSRPERQRRS